MALRQRIVKGTLVDGDGNPIESGTISFKPTKVLGYTSTHVVIDREFTVTTDSNGDFSATFWCDEDSLVAIDYLVTFPVENSGQPEPLHFAVISLAYEDGSDKDIGTLIAESQPPPSSVPEYVWASLIDSRIGNGAIVPISGTAYMIDEIDAGKTIVTTNGSAVTITVPDALPIGFQCLVMQDGDGQVQFTSSDATVRNRQSHTKIAGKYGVAAILKIDTGEFRLQGDTAS